MSDVPEPIATTASSATPNPLRAIREEAGMHLTTLAAMLKVPPQKLEALEAGRYDDLPNLTFARALATSVCRVLKVDPAPVLAALPQAQSVHIRQSDEGLNTPFPLAGGSSTVVGLNTLLPLFRRPVFWMAAVLVLAGLMWLWLPENLGRLVDQAEPVAAVTELPSAGEADAEPVPAPAPEVSELAAGGNTALTDSGATVFATVESATPSQAETPETLQAAPAPTPQQEEPVLTLRVHAPSWVQVTGASGRLLLQRTLQPAEEVSFGADMPLSVVLGRADVAVVHVRGVAFDLTPYVRNRVARFDVK